MSVLANPLPNFLELFQLWATVQLYVESLRHSFLVLPKGELNCVANLDADHLRLVNKGVSSIMLMQLAAIDKAKSFLCIE